MTVGLTADCLIFAQDTNSVLLVERANAPFRGLLAIPGGFLDEGETFKEAALRELAEETGLRLDKLKGNPILADAADRDPRGRVISVCYAAVIHDQVPVKGQDDARRALWVPIEDAEEMSLAFDHHDIIERVLTGNAWALSYANVVTSATL